MTHAQGGVVVTLLAMGVVGPVAVLLLHKIGLRRVRDGAETPRWLLRSFVREYLVVRDGVLTYRHHRTDERVTMRDIARIDYHYHAVVGFVGIYELIMHDGHRVAIAETVPGFDRFWSAAREVLPGLGTTNRQADIAAGGWQDSLTVWTLREANQSRRE